MGVISLLLPSSIFGMIAGFMNVRAPVMSYAGPRARIPEICRHWDTWEPFLMRNNSSEKDYWFQLIVEECDDNDKRTAVGTFQRSCHCHLLEANSLKWLLVIYWKLLAAGCCCDKNVGIPHILDILFWLNLSRLQMELEQLQSKRFFLASDVDNLIQFSASWESSPWLSLLIKVILLTPPRSPPRPAIHIPCQNTRRMWREKTVGLVSSKNAWNLTISCSQSALGQPCELWAK